MTPKDWVDIVKTVAEILGILVATSLAVLRWGRPSWPGILIRNILFIRKRLVPTVFTECE
jgi:hypothetical protein